MPNQRDRTVFKKMAISGAVMIVVVVLVAYSPALRVGFYDDDWMYFEKIGRLGPGEYVVRSFSLADPSFLNTYRPIQGVLFAVEYSLFGKDALGFRVVGTLLHAINALLVCLIVWALAQNPRLTFLAGLFYASLPIYSLSVFLVSAPDVYATLFYLLAVWLWLIYLQNGNRRIFVLTHLVFVLGLLSKESVATLPIVLFLIDVFLVGKSNRFAILRQRYLWMAILLVGYALFEISIQPRTFNYQVYRISIGPHILFNAASYVSKLVFPWNVDIQSLWFLVLLGLLVVALRARSALVLFMGAWAALNILPIVGFATKSSPRFLYLSGVASAAILAWTIDAGKEILRRSRYRIVLASGISAAIILFGVNGVAQAGQDFAQSAFEERWLFRDISQQHRTFPNDTYLYFLNTADVYFPHLSGMFYWRYGDQVTVDSVDIHNRPQFVEHANALIYYLNSQGTPIEVPVDKNAVKAASLQASVNFGGIIRLEDYQLSSASVKPGTEMALLLYWRAEQAIDKNYTVFVHWVGSDGTLLAGWDSQPAMGRAPTTGWRPGALNADWTILSIPDAATLPPDSHLEVGLYDLPTMQRLPVVDAQGNEIADHVVIAPFGAQ